MSETKRNILSCGVAQDLLPLYAEGLTGDESRTAVEQHLAGCPACREMLAALRSPAPAAQAAATLPAAPLRKVDRALRRRRRLSVALAVCLVLAAAVAAVARLTAPQYLAFGDAGLDVRVKTVYPVTPDDLSGQATDAELLQDGAAEERYTVSVGRTQPTVQLEIAGVYEGCGADRVFYEENGVTYADYTLSVWKYPLGGEYKEGTLLLEPTDAQAVRVWFTDYDGEDVLLYGNAAGGRQTLSRLALNYYALLSAAAAAVLGLAAALTHKRPRLCRGLCAAAELPACYLLGHLAVKFPGGSSNDLLRDLGFLLLTAALLYAAARLAAARRREERG